MQGGAERNHRWAEILTLALFVVIIALVGWIFLSGAKKNHDGPGTTAQARPLTLPEVARRAQLAQQ
jgi:cbb3-type cytochrome oxidase subunit 3